MKNKATAVLNDDGFFALPVNRALICAVVHSKRCRQSVTWGKKKEKTATKLDKLQKYHDFCQQ